MAGKLRSVISKFRFTTDLLNRFTDNLIQRLAALAILHPTSESKLWCKCWTLRFQPKYHVRRIPQASNLPQTSTFQSVVHLAHTSFLFSPPPRVELPVQSPSLKFQWRFLRCCSWAFPMATSPLPTTTIAHKRWRSILFAEVVDLPLALACLSRMTLLAMLPLRSSALHSLLVIQKVSSVFLQVAFQPDNWTNSSLTCTRSRMLSETIPLTRSTTGTDLTGQDRYIWRWTNGQLAGVEQRWTFELLCTWPGHCERDEVCLSKLGSFSLFNNKLRKKCMCSQKFVPAGIDVYTRSRHLASTKHEVVYYKTPAAKPLVSAKVRFCNAHTADSPHVHSPAQGKSTNVGQNQKRSCRTILPYTPSGQTRRLELLTALASTTS